MCGSELLIRFLVLLLLHFQRVIVNGERGLLEETRFLSHARRGRLLPGLYLASPIVSTRSSPLPLNSERNPAYDAILCSADSILRIRLDPHLPLSATYWLMYQSRGSFSSARASWVKGGISYHLVRGDRQPQPPTRRVPHDFVQPRATAPSSRRILIRVP